MTGSETPRASVPGDASGARDTSAPGAAVRSDAAVMRSTAAAAAIRVSGASKVYGTGPDRHVALDGVDLSIERGRFVSIIGPSGCGKSTLLRLIAGLEEADAGEVNVFGVTPERATAAKMIGFVPQTPALLPWLSVLDNVRLPARINSAADRRRSLPDMRDLLAKAGLSSVIDKLPAQLSGGMQQRTAFVRALGIRPEVLLMDEPFSALDEFTREAIQGQLLDIWDDLNTTVVFVTHSVTEAVRLSDTVLVMSASPGRVTASVDITLERPRREALLRTAEFHRVEDTIREHLHSAWRGDSVPGGPFSKAAR
jgi:NitT/TauT family transport system ATP-binding protein